MLRILKLIEQVQSLGLEIEMICPDHGIIWRKDPGKIIDAYVKWSQPTAGKKAVVIYDSMWNSTKMMAEAMKFEMVDPGVKIQYIPDTDGLSACYDYGKKIAQAVIG